MTKPVRTPAPTIVPVSLPGREYEIAIGLSWADLPGRIRSDLQTDANRPSTALVIYDAVLQDRVDRVAEALQAAHLRPVLISVPSGERSKSIDRFEAVLEAMAASKADRQSVVFAYGGGVIGDLAGYAAASFLRGVRFVQIPTTLLAAVDSSVGGKTGINLAAGKNLVGAFHQPRAVYILTEHFDTLPAREWGAGLAEVVKYGVLGDADFFERLEDNAAAIARRDPSIVQTIIQRCCELKAGVVLDDERETSGRRATLNYGHTFAHAYENLLGYGTLLHGEAVAIGIVHAATLSERLGRTDARDTRRQIELLDAFSLPTRLPTALDANAVINAMRSDKKAAAGAIRFILPTRIGHVELVDDVPLDLVRSVLVDAGCTT